MMFFEKAHSLISSRNLLQEHAKLVVEENSILMQEIELKDRRIEELEHDYQSEGLHFYFSSFSNTSCNVSERLSQVEIK